MILEQCKGVQCVDLGESFPTHIYLQKLASIRPRTSPPKFARSEDLAGGPRRAERRASRGSQRCRAGSRVSPQLVFGCIDAENSYSIVGSTGLDDLNWFGCFTWPGLLRRRAAQQTAVIGGGRNLYTIRLRRNLCRKGWNMQVQPTNTLLVKLKLP